MEKMKVWVIFISLVSLMIVVYSCSSDDSFIDEMETYEIASRSVTPNLDTILNSPEFQNLDKAYTELISIIRNSVENLTQDEIDEFSELHLLYKSDSLKYESLYKYFICNSLFKNNYNNVEKAYRSFENAKEEFLLNGQCKAYIENNEMFITSLLMQNAGQVIPIRSLIKTTKTRSEESIQKCLDLCKEQYELEIAKALVLLSCSTAVNLITCLISGGFIGLANSIAQIGIIAVYEIEVAFAAEEYELCKKGCYI